MSGAINGQNKAPAPLKRPSNPAAAPAAPAKTMQQIQEEVFKADYDRLLGNAFKTTQRQTAVIGVGGVRQGEATFLGPVASGMALGAFGGLMVGQAGGPIGAVAGLAIGAVVGAALPFAMVATDHAFQRLDSK